MTTVEGATADVRAANDLLARDAREVLYKEYVRLSTQMNDYAASSFADFKLLAVVGASAGVIVNLGQKLGKHEPMWVTPMLAFSTLALVAILAFRDVLKQSVLFALVPHLSAIEDELRKRYELTDTEVLCVGKTMRFWYEKRRLPGAAFGGVFLLSVGGLPVYAMCEAGERGVAGVYAALTVAVFVVLSRISDRVLTGLLTATISEAAGLANPETATARRPETTQV